jgi:hypothetical protein
MFMRSVVWSVTTAGAALAIGATPALSAPAVGWSASHSVGEGITGIAIDDAGRGVAVRRQAVVPITRRGVTGEPVPVPPGAADVDVAPGGLVAVAVVTDPKTVSLGVGTTASPPTDYAPFVTGRGIDDIDVAAGSDGRILLALIDRGPRVTIARRSPGASGPRIDRIVGFPGQPYAPGSITGVQLTSAGTPIVSWGGSTNRVLIGGIVQADRPDGEFGRVYGEDLTLPRSSNYLLHERTGFSSAFSSVSTDLVLGRAAAGRATMTVFMRGVGRWAAAVGANGAAALAFNRDGRLMVRRRDERGRWEGRTTLAPGAAGNPAVAVDAVARVTVAFPLGGRVLAASQVPGDDFTRVGPIPGSRGCAAVTLAGAAAGRALALLKCRNGGRIAAFNPPH